VVYRGRFTVSIGQVHDSYSWLSMRQQVMSPRSTQKRTRRRIYSVPIAIPTQNRLGGVNKEALGVRRNFVTR
jgi:hypothetical protein